MTLRLEGMTLKKVLLILGIIVVILLLGYVFMNKAFFRPEPGYRDTTIQQFRENYQTFLKVKQYADEGEEALYVYDSPWRFLPPIIENWGGEAIQDPPIKDEINRLIFDFHFDSIAEYDDGNITFAKRKSNDEWGIAYSPNENFPFYIVEIQELGDNWYFYETMYPD